MAFYSDFAGHYEKIFPYREAISTFLQQWLPPGGKVLDVGCGTGRYCRALAAAGYQTVGIDLDPGMISEAEKVHPSGDFRMLDMEQIGLLSAGSYSGVVCLGNVLPHLAAGRLTAFLMDVKRLLVPGGVWIFQTVNFDPLLKREEFRFPERKFAGEDLTFLRWYEDIGPDQLTFHTSLLDATHEIFGGQVLLYPQTSVEYFMGHKRAGFVKLGHFADFSGREFDPVEISGSVFVFRMPDNS